jgi:hypothetical protein
MFESIGTPSGPNWKLRIASAAVVIALGTAVVSLWRVTQMPLKSYKGALPPLSASQLESAHRLSDHVRYLSTTIGERNTLRDGSLKAAADYIRRNLTQSGYIVTEQTYTVEGTSVSNLEAELTGSETSLGTVVVGAHYDTVSGTGGADDNTSGVAAALELARLLKGSKFRKTIRFAFFVNEEPPFFQTEQMGSLVYAKRLRQERVPISAMISLETLGFYSDRPGSQKYPAVLGLFYPSRGDFVGFVGNIESRDLVRRAIRSFRESTRFPSEGVAAPATWPGIGWSDQWSFWQEGYPAIMITDTAIFRYSYYHTSGDTSGKINIEKMARVTEGTSFVIEALADE